VAQIVTGGTHTCALTAEGGVVCWGANDFGQLGNGTTDQRAEPVAVQELSSGVMSLSLAWGRTCALTTLGRVYCWGGEYISGDSNYVPVEFIGLGNQVVQLAVGETHACALTSSGQVLCWGFNSNGELGNGTFVDSPTPVVAIPSNASQITVGYYASCAAMKNGEVLCWGGGVGGLLGDGVAGNHNSNIPVRVLNVGGSPLVGVSQVELGLVFGCAIVGSGVYCWGTNRFGQLGNGTIENVVLPFASPVLNSLGGSPLTGADQISTGESFACVHMTSGQLKCWGNNTMGQHGNGGVVNSGVPLTVRNMAGTASLEGAANVTTGSWQTCTFSNWEAVNPFFCWGANWMGQLGTGTAPGIEMLPLPVADISSLAGGGGGMGQELQIVAGGVHTCSLTNGGGLKCWGANTNGQLGDGTTTDRLNPVDVAGMGSDVVSMALGDNFTCALIPWGRLKCWGENTHGQLGNGSKIDSALPLTAKLANVTVKQVAAGSGHTCALTLTGSVLCWGDNTFGQLGDGTTDESISPVEAIASGAVGVALGGSTSCAVMDDGGVKCWGLGDMGQLGDAGSGAEHKQLLPVDVQVSAGGLLTGAGQVAVGANFGCALLEGSLVDCWGKNDVGQLGQGTVSEFSAIAAPVLMEADGDPLQGATQVSAGGAHACVRMYTDRLKCWGQGESGQLGDGSSGSSAYSAHPLPVVDHFAPFGTTIPYLESTSQVSTGSAHTCAFIKWNGSNPYRCWGDNSRGQLGDGEEASSGQVGVQQSLTIRLYPNPVQDALNFGSPPLAKIAGGNGFTCALTRAGGVKCWGSDEHGELGNGVSAASDTPVNVVGLSSGVIGLAAGSFHACALTSAGGVKCWGYNWDGQLGNGILAFPGANQIAPVDVVGLSSGVVELSLGNSHSCALTSEGAVKCWGANDWGALGDGTQTTSSTPVNVSGLGSEVIGIALGSGFTCALTSLGGVKCWGANPYGQLGNGTNTASQTPVSVTGLSSGVIGLVTGNGHVCALTSVGGVKCWGLNAFGQVGDGTNTNRNIPVPVVGLSSGVIGLAAGGGHTCALTSAGTLKCWGRNLDGELGDSSNTNRNSPVNVNGLAGNVTSVSKGEYHTCAVLGGIGPLRCWGNNWYGQLGTGDKISSNVPVISKWLTAEGLVEDAKTEVILPTPNIAVVISPTPIDTPVVVVVTQVITPPLCSDCIPVDVALQLEIDSDEKPRLPMYFHWQYTSPLLATSGALLSDDEFSTQTLNIYKYIEGDWIPMLPCTGCSLDTSNHVIIATLDGEGIYALMMRPQTDYYPVYLPLVIR